MITSTKIFESNSKMIVGSLTQESTINLMIMNHILIVVHLFGFVPYAYSNTFNLIVKVFDFDFYVENSLITTIKQSNVTVLESSFVEKRTKLFKPHQVKVTSSESYIKQKLDRHQR